MRVPHPRLTIALFPHAARANELSQALQEIGTMSVFVILIIMPIRKLKSADALLSAVVTILQEPFCSEESPTCQ